MKLANLSLFLSSPDSALPADNLIPQVDSLCTNIDCSATMLHRCSTHQYYTGEETVTSTFVPKFLCLDRSRDTKAAQTTDVINVEDRGQYTYVYL